MRDSIEFRTFRAKDGGIPLSRDLIFFPNQGMDGHGIQSLPIITKKSRRRGNYHPQISQSANHPHQPRRFGMSHKSADPLGDLLSWFIYEEQS
jgi:hypothetical protein